MKKKTTKKKEPQIVEIHIYVHQNSSSITYNPYPQIYPNGGGGAGPAMPGTTYPYTTC